MKLLKTKYLLFVPVLVGIIIYLFFVKMPERESIQNGTAPVTENDLDESSDTDEQEPQERTSYKDMIFLETPLDGAAVSPSPLVIKGEARGTWFFEATFPIILTNWDGLIIAEGYATALSDWMTEDYVPFEAEITYEPDTIVSNRGFLILQKANPSGLPENDDALEITIYY
jgi:hypothetical protein